jgi:hypothetical protein
MKLKAFFAHKYWNLLMMVLFVLYLILTIYELSQGVDGIEKPWRWVIRLLIFTGAAFTQFNYFIKKSRAANIKDQPPL